MTRLLLTSMLPVLVTAVAHADIQCPDGAVKGGAEPPDSWSAWCEMDGVRHGPYAMWFPDGTLMRQGAMEMGVLHGQQRSWYRNGQLAEEVVYEHGVRAGTWKRWHRNGKPAVRMEHRDGVLHRAEYWHANGKLARKSWYRNGVLERERFWDQRGKRLERMLTGGIRGPTPQNSRASNTTPAYPRVERRERFVAPLPVLTLREASAFVDGAFFTEPLCDAAVHAFVRIVFRQHPGYTKTARRIICERSARFQLCVALARDFDDMRACRGE